MKILIGHMADSVALPRFVQSSRWQGFLGGWPEGVDRVLVTDDTVQFNSIPTITVPKPPPDLFNLSRMRNALLDHARKGGYDGLFILESDFLILRWMAQLPQFWSIPYSVYDHPSKLSFEDLPEGVENTKRVPDEWRILGSRPLIPVHCVILNSAVFDFARWDEKFCGNGYDDWDFCNQMSGKYGPFSDTGMLLCHRWHSTTASHPRPENRAYYESKWGKI